MLYHICVTDNVLKCSCPFARHENAWGNRSVASLILNLRTRWGGWSTSRLRVPYCGNRPPYLLSRRLYGPRGYSGCFGWGRYKYHTSAGDQTRILGLSAHILVTQPTEISLKIICFGLVSLVILLAISNRFENFECLINLGVSHCSKGFLSICYLKAHKSIILHLQL